MARPTDLTPKMAAALVKLVEGGLPLLRAAEHEGLHYSTLKRWMTRKGPPYEEFSASLKTAKAVSQKKMVDEIREGVNNWQARAWYLERSDPQHWGRKDRLEQTIKQPSDAAAMRDLVKSILDDDAVKAEVLEQLKGAVH
jgi:lambda repressor-like predicted transcriptional regulator